MSYNSADIQFLEDLDHIRKRPGMYIADTGKAGLHQLLREVIDNAIDEWLAGGVTTVKIGLGDDRTDAWVADDGRGIPFDHHDQIQDSTLVGVFTKLHGGGKFDSKAYSVSAGLHGVGIKATNALSEWLQVWTRRKRGKGCYVCFHSGVLTQPPKTVSCERGTWIHFKPDVAVFGKRQRFDDALVRGWLRDISYLCPGLRLELHIGPEVEVFCATDGLSDFLLDWLAEEGSSVEFGLTAFEEGDIQVALAWTDGEGERIRSFVNVAETKDGGTHVTGLRKSVATTLKAMKFSVPSNTDDLREGLRVVLHLKHGDPKFKGQTKTKLLNEGTTALVQQFISKLLEEKFTDDPKIPQRLIQRAEALRAARAKFKADRSAIKSTKVKRVKGILPGKLCEASAEAWDRELFIVEGDSAGGTVKLARNPKTQELLPLRGKVLNTARADLGKLLNNEELRAITLAVGAGLADQCDPSTARIGKILLLMDADPDGQHILALLLSFFTRYMHPVIEAGMLYIVDSPLFVAQQNGNRFWGHSLGDLEAQGVKTKTALVSRLKGHGEANPDELRSYALNADSRRLWRVVLADGDDEAILDLMGTDAEVRRQLLGIE